MLLVKLYVAPDDLILEICQSPTILKNPGSMIARDSHEYVPSNCFICELKEITFRNVQKYNKTSSNTIYLIIYRAISNIFRPIHPSSGCLQE